MRTRFSNFTPLRESGGSLRPSVKEAGGGRVYRGVTLIRAGLGNRRDMNYYPEGALKESAQSGMFEGLKAYADHPTAVDEQIQPERTVRDFVGLYTNTKYREGRGGRPGRVTGDLRILKAHRWLSDVVDELIEIGQADKIGISINGNGKTERKPVRESGEELEANVVTKFMALRSADVVTEAGAGGGFQQILESARGASQETPMNRKAILKSLREAADAGDTDKVKELTTKLEECGDDMHAAPAKGKGKKKTPVTEADKDTKDDDADEDDDAEDPDRELDEATDDVKDESVDDDADDDGADTDDLDESDSDDDDADEDGDDVEESDADGADDDEGRQSRSAVDKLKRHSRDSADRRTAAGGDDKRTKENAIQGYGGKGKKKNLNGVPPKGKGSFNDRSGAPRGQKGRRYSESEGGDRNIAGVNRLELRDENSRLKRQLSKERQRNERLAESLGAHRRADLARKLLKESGIAAELRPALVKRLVRGCPSGDLREAQRYMEDEIAFHQRLVESVAGRAADSIEDDFDVVEGAGSRFRESYNGDAGDENEFVSTFREAGLPMKATKKDK